MAARVPARLSPTPAAAAAQGRKFGLTVGAAFLVLAALSRWRGHAVAPAALASLGGLLVVAALLIPARLGPVERAWMGLAHAISKVTTPIIMGVMYFVLFTPVGALRRALGKNPLRRPSGAASFWVDRAAGARRSNLERQF